MEKGRIILFTIALLFCATTTRGQGTPGTVRCPTQTDTLDSLFRINDAARTVLADVLTSSAASVTVSSTATFPASGSIKIDNEIIYYSSKTDTSFGTLVRGASGTAAASHNNSALVTAPILAAHHNTLAQAVICAQQLALGLSTVPSTRTVNGHPLSADVAVTSSDLGLVIGTNVEAYDADLLAIAGLTPTNDDVIQRKAGAWANRTMVQLKSDLVLVKGDVGLGNVVNLDTSTTANISDSTDKRFVTDAQRTQLGALPYDVAAGYDGAPPASSTIRIVAVRSFNLPSSMAGTKCSAGTAATAQTDFLVKVNGTTKATLRFAASGTTCSIVGGTTTSISAADVITIVAPGTPDATLADIAISLLGVLP